MNWSKTIEKAIKKQNMDLTIAEIPLNIFLKCGDILFNCFIEDEEKNELMSIVETNKTGGEEIRVLDPEEISYISVVYAQPQIKSEQDKMFN